MRRTTLDRSELRAHPSNALIGVLQDIIVPESQHSPASFFQLPIDLGIPPYVTFDLLPPKALVSRDVFRSAGPAAAVPERRVTEYGQPRPYHGEVGAAGNTPILLAVPDPGGPNRRAECSFDQSPGTLDPGHVEANDRRRPHAFESSPPSFRITVTT